MSGKEHKNVRLEVLNDLNTQITVLWDVTPCNLVDRASEMSWTIHPNDIASHHIPDQHCCKNSVNLYHIELHTQMTQHHITSQINTAVRTVWICTTLKILNVIKIMKIEKWRMKIIRNTIRPVHTQQFYFFNIQPAVCFGQYGHHHQAVYNNKRQNIHSYMGWRYQKKLTKGRRKGKLTNAAPECVHSYVHALCWVVPVKCD